MKKSLTYLLLCGALTSLYSCADNDEHEENVEETTETVMITDDEGRMKVNVEERMKNFRMECWDKANCDDPGCQDEILMLHELDEPTYQSFIEDYYNAHDIAPNEIPAPKSMTRAQVEAMTNGACDASRLVFDLGSNHATHDDVQLNKTNGWDRPAGEANSYSIALFKGILNRGAETFKFSRAIGPSGNNTMAIAAYDGAGTPVYFGDLSALYPRK